MAGMTSGFRRYLQAAWRVIRRKNHIRIHESNFCNALQLIKVQSIKRSDYKNDACIAAVFFGQNIHFANTKIFTTFCPTSEFVSCAVSKKVQNVVYLAKKNDLEIEKEYGICQRFPHNFGRIIDLLGSYNK